MRNKRLPLFLASALLLASCSVSGQSSATPSSEVSSDSSVTSSVSESSSTSVSSEATPIEVNNKFVNVYGANNEIVVNNALEGETFTYEHEGDAIRFEGDKVIGLRGGSKTDVTIKSNLGRTGTFKVTVRNSEYKSTHATTEASEGWFDEVDIDPVANMTSNFANGMDISSLKQLYDHGAKYYDKNGNETSLLLILKDAGVNWVRIRVWHDPYDRDANGNITFSYGGGETSAENMAWIAHEAKAAGLKVLLDFHYSDFWAHPGQQVMPKAWVNCTTSDQIADKIKEYTTDTLTYFDEQDALPDAVQIGNETTSGIILQYPGGKTTTASGNAPKYISDSTNLNSSIRGGYTQGGTNTNFKKYHNAGLAAVKEYNSKILTMIHIAKGLTGTDQIRDFFNSFDLTKLDILGLSAYTYHQYTKGRKSTLTNLNTVSNDFPNKKICIAENAYGFTYETDSAASNEFGSSYKADSYEVTIQGQAEMIRDAAEAIANLPQNNGFGCFYWEGAWLPVNGCGWADEASKDSWANQALFSYNGKALGSLGVYNKMLGK